MIALSLISVELKSNTAQFWWENLQETYLGIKVAGFICSCYNKAFELSINELKLHVYVLHMNMNSFKKIG